jgi:hypothetical protein
MKTFYLMFNVGKVKYLVNFHNGIKTYKDGSPFFDIGCFKNKKKLNAFIKDLKKDGYTER